MMQAPKPKKIPYILEQHNHSRTDNYYWLRDDSRTNKEMLSYLESENEYADQWFSSRKPYSDEIADELIQQIPDEETSFGFTNNKIKYFTVTGLTFLFLMKFNVAISITNLSYQNDKWWNNNNTKDIYHKVIGKQYPIPINITPNPHNTVLNFFKDINQFYSEFYRTLNGDLTEFFNSKNIFFWPSASRIISSKEASAPSY